MDPVEAIIQVNVKALQQLNLWYKTCFHLELDITDPRYTRDSLIQFTIPQARVIGLIPQHRSNGW